MIAVLVATAMRWRGIAILVVTIVLPLVVFRLRTIDKTRHKLPAFILFLSSFVPLYVASLGPYYFLAVNVLSKGSPILIFGSYFYLPLFALLKTNSKQLFEPFFEHYLIDWIGYGFPRIWKCRRTWYACTIELSTFRWNRKERTMWCTKVAAGALLTFWMWSPATSVTTDVLA